METRSQRGVPISALALPGWLLLATIPAATWLGLVLPASAALAVAPALVGLAAFAVGRAGLVRVAAVGPSRDRLAPGTAAAGAAIAAAVVAAALVFLFLQTNHLHDCQCHQGYTLAVWRGALPPPALHDATQPSAYHFGFDVLAALLHAAFRPPSVEMSLDLASGLVFLALALAAAGLLARWAVPPGVRALGVLLLVFGLGPVFLASLGDAAGGVDDWTHRWHAGTFLSVVGLAGRRPAALGVLALVLFLDLLRSGGLAAPGRRGVWGGALLLGTLAGAAALVAEELLLFGAIGLVAWWLPARRGGARAGETQPVSGPSGGLRWLRAMVPLLAVLVPVLVLSVLSGGLLRAVLFGGDGAPALGLASPGLPSFRGRAPIGSLGYWTTLALELGPLPFLLPALLARGTGTPRPYARALLAIAGVGFGLANVLSFGGYDTDLHRLALPLAHLGFLHAPVLLWTLLAPRRRLAVAVLAGAAALSLVSALGYLFRAVGPLDQVANAFAPASFAQEVRPFLALLPAAAALALLARRWRRPWRWASVAAAVTLVVLGGAERREASRSSDPWPDARCSGALDARGSIADAADRAEALLDDGHPGPILATAPVADALLARGRPIVGQARPPEHGRVDPDLHRAWLRAFGPAEQDRYRPGLAVLPPGSAEALAARVPARIIGESGGFRFLALTDARSEARRAPVVIRRPARVGGARSGRPAVCPSAQGRALSPAQQDTVLALLRPYQADGTPPGGPGDVSGAVVGDVSVDADGFVVEILERGGAATSVRFGGCPERAPFATTASFYVTAEPPGPAAGAVVAAVAANDDGAFWANGDLAVLEGAETPAGADPSPLPTTLAFAAFALLAVTLVTRSARAAAPGERGAGT